MAPLVEILVVDDSKVMREMIIECLRPQPGLVFTHASSGLEALEQLALRVFSLMVLDLSMPDIDGFEVIAFARGQDKHRSLPIIVATTRGDDSSMGRALGAGATRFMTKPFAQAAILSDVRALLGDAIAAPR